MVEESIRFAKSDFVPIISKLPGFVSYSIIRIDPNTLASISTFNSKAEADVSTEEAKKWVIDNGVQSMYNLQEIIAGEVA